MKSWLIVDYYNIGMEKLILESLAFDLKSLFKMMNGVIGLSRV
jgi:hypothetical protein